MRLFSVNRMRASVSNVGRGFCVAWSRVFREEWVADFAWWCQGVLAWGCVEWDCVGFGFYRLES